eukprot:gene3879-2759_t
MHPNRQIVASGEDGANPEVVVWDSENLQVLFRTKGHHQNGISKLAFAPNGLTLLSLDNNELKTLIVHNWQDGTLIFKDTLEGKFTPCGLILNKTTIVSTCDTKIWFWVKYSEGYIRRNGVFPKNKAEEAIVTMIPTANGENVIAGTIVGRLMMWVGINCVRVVKAHSSAVLCLSLCHEGFLSAGKDARIRMWSNTLEPKFLFDVSRFGTMPIIMGVSMSIDATSILFGNQGADAFEISAIDGSDLRGGPVIKSHAFGTINDLDTHPSKFEYATVGFDRTVRVIDMKTKTLLKLATLDVQGRAVAYSPLGDVLAVATDNQTSTSSVFVILNEETLQIIHSARDSKHSATVLKYSPEGDTLAVGIEDGSIYLYSVNDDYELIARCSRHTRAITAIDFSKDGEFLRSNSIDGELYYFNVDDGEYQSNISSMRDVLWATQHCVFSWHTKGIHTHPTDREVTTSCAIPPPDPGSVTDAAPDANNQSIGRAQQKLVCGSSLGQLRAFAYPAVHDVADHFRYQPVSTSSVHLATVGVNQVLFWRSVTGRFPTAVGPNWRETGHNQTFPCCEVFGGNVVVGTSDGNLYVFDTEAAAIKQMIKVHNGAVYTLRVSANGKLLLSGGRDSTVRIWDKTFECLKEYPVEMMSKSNHSHIPRAVAMRPDGGALLIGTQGAEILEVSMKDASLNVGASQIRGHTGALYAIASHPTKENFFVTAGDDAILRVWDARQRRVHKAMKLELGARAVAFHPAGAMFAVGFGTGKRTKGKQHAKEGSFALLVFDTLKIIHEGQDTTVLITAMQFSPDGKFLAIGSEDNAIYTYEIQDNTFCTFRHTLRPHAAPIKSLDFSANSIVLMSVDRADRICYSMIQTGLPIVNTDEVRDETWVRYTSPITFATQGLWLTQERDHYPTTCAKAASGLLLASANSIGDISVTRFPASERMGFVRPGGHVGRVSGIVWQPGDECFLTIGTDDCLVMQWRVGWQSSAFASPASDYSFTREDTNDDNASYFRIENPLDYQFESLFHDHGADAVRRDQTIVSSLSVSAAESMTVLAGQDPSTFPHDTAQPNPQEFRDDHVLFHWHSMICDPSSRQSLLANAALDASFNYRLDDCHYHGSQRNASQPSLFYNPEGDMLYAIGNRGVLYDRNTQRQRYYTGHVAEVAAMAMSADRQLVATSDRQSFPEIHVWDAYVGRCIKIFKGFHRYNVRALAFSSCRRFLLSIGEDAYHSLVVFHSPSGQWHDGFYQASSSVSLGNAAFCLRTSTQPLYPLLVGGEDGHLHLFRDVQGSLEHVTQRLDSQQRIQSLLCAAETKLLSDDGLELARSCVLVGSSVGFLYAVTMDVTVAAEHGATVHDKGVCQVIQRISAHEGALYAVVTVHPATTDVVVPQSVVTLGRDQCLRVWSSKLKLLHTVDLNKVLHATHGLSLAVRMCYSAERHALLLSLAQGDLFEFSLTGKTSFLITEGHDRGELHGLACNPVVPDEFATVGDDGVVRIWHRGVKYVLRRCNLRVASRCIAYAPDGLSLVVGVGRPGHVNSHPKDGSVIVLRTSDLAVQREERKGKKYVSDVALSSTGELLAIACYDGRVFLCDYLTLATLHVVDMDTRRPAIRVDFAMDDSALRVAYLPDRLLYFSLDRKEVVANPTEVRDVQWRTNNCAFSWATQGVFLPKPPFQPRKLDTDEVVLDEADTVDPATLNEQVTNGAKRNAQTGKQTAVASASAVTTADAQVPAVTLPVVTAMALHKPKKCMVVAYEDGLVSLFPYPCITRDNEVELCRVSSYVSRIQFSADNKTVVMTEAGSRAVVQATLAFPSTSPLLMS